MENQYFKCIVKVLFEDEKGRVKKRRDEYMVFGLNPTDVQAKITKRLDGEDFEILQVSLTKIIDLVE